VRWSRNLARLWPFSKSDILSKLLILLRCRWCFKVSEGPEGGIHPPKSPSRGHVLVANHWLTMAWLTSKMAKVELRSCATVPQSLGGPGLHRFSVRLLPRPQAGRRATLNRAARPVQLYPNGTMRFQEAYGDSCGRTGRAMTREAAGAGSTGRRVSHAPASMTAMPSASVAVTASPKQKPPFLGRVRVCR